MYTSAFIDLVTPTFLTLRQQTSRDASRHVGRRWSRGNQLTCGNAQSREWRRPRETRTKETYARSHPQILLGRSLGPGDRAQIKNLARFDQTNPKHYLSLRPQNGVGATLIKYLGKSRKPNNCHKKSSKTCHNSKNTAGAFAHFRAHFNHLF